MWWGYGFHPFFGFGFSFFGFLFVLMIVRLVAFRRCGWGHHGWHDGRFEAEAILKRRLASGEISEADYLHLKETLAR